MSALALQGLRLAFATESGAVGAVVLQDVSFELQAGASLGVLGASGSGKSLTALACLGLLPAGARVLGGSLRLAGQELLGAEETVWQKVRGGGIGLVFQEPFSALNPLMRVGEQIAESLRLHKGLTHEGAALEAAAWLERVGLTPGPVRARQYPHQYSGGMRQRALIALALAAGPRVLIADEPTTALDATVQSQIIALLKQLQAQLGFALLIISHDLGVIEALADEALVMQAGRVVERARMQDLIHQPQSQAAQRLLAAYAAFSEP